MIDAKALPKILSTLPMSNYSFLIIWKQGVSIGQFKAISF